jgi:hypothetical protein
VAASIIVAASSVVGGSVASAVAASGGVFGGLSDPVQLVATAAMTATQAPGWHTILCNAMSQLVLGALYTILISIIALHLRRLDWRSSLSS